MRSLTQRSASAAREIKALIDDSVHKVGQGNDLVDAAGATMREVVDSVQQAAAIMHGITANSREQGSGIAQVDAALAELDAITPERGPGGGIGRGIGQRSRRSGQPVAGAVGIQVR